MRSDLWGSITCGQNLDVKELTRLIPDKGSPERDYAISAHGHGLDHDRAIETARARSDVTMGLWKSSRCPHIGARKKPARSFRAGFRRRSCATERRLRRQIVPCF